jgi:glutamyl-Q tRNA(Asp) synthetase
MQTRDPLPYVGRFAPSPTGPLHFGSLVAAVASYLQAQAQDGRWLLRIEDIDPPREQPAASEEIVEALQRYGFDWDGDVIFQSTSNAAHESALAWLIEQGHTYRCRCSRRDLDNVPRGTLGIIYPGFCRNGCDAGDAAIRLRTNDAEVAFDDKLQGRVAQQLESESGDFVIRRRDGLIAYHLAVVVDDEIQGVTEVVRGIDLIDSTPRQIYLQNLLGYRSPGYAHIPVVTHTNGDKLSKLTGAPGIPFDSVSKTLCTALRALRMEPPAILSTAGTSDIWIWARNAWQMEGLFGRKTIINTA